MGKLEQAEANFKSAHFYSALESYVDVLKGQEFSVEERLFATERLLLIFDKLNKELPIDVLELIANLYSEAENYHEAQEVYQKLLKDRPSLIYYEELILNLKRTGDIQKTRQVYFEYFDYLLESKLATKASNFLEKQELSFLGERDRLFCSIRVCLAQGNYRALADLVLRLSVDLSYDDKILMDFIIESLDSHGSLWKGDDKLCSLILDYFCHDEVLKKEDSKERRKFVVKLIYDAVFLDDLKNKGLALAKIYSRVFHKKTFGHSASYLTEAVENMEFFSSLKDEKSSSRERIDLGIDLKDRASKDESEKIVRNINFLINAGRMEKAFDLARTLRRIEPDNPILKKFFKKEEEEEEASDKIMESLLREISRYTGYDSPTDNIDYEVLLKKVILSIPLNEACENESDLVFALNSLNFPSLSILFIRSLTEKGVKDSLERGYLLLRSLIMAKEYYQALDLINDIIGLYPLLDDEKAEFAYVKGDVLENLGEKKKALEAFQFSNKLRPGYRLSRERIREIEKNK